MENKLDNIPTRFFFCPASDYLNEHNETGSHGQLSYNFLKHLAMKPSVESIFAAVMMSLPVTPIPKTKIYALIHKNGDKPSLNDFDSLYFYLVSFVNLFRSEAYLKADVVHHIIPFKFGRSFNLFFLWKNKRKKYIIGPIVSPHINEQMSDDEEYVFIEKKSHQMRLLEIVFKIATKTSLLLFSSLLHQLSLKTLQNADILIFSDNYSLQCHKKFIKKNQKTVILDTGIDVTIFKPVNKSIQKKKNHVIQVLFVGRFTKRKGCEYLIRALYEARLMKKDIQLHCTILGFGPLKDKLENLVKELKLTDDITFREGVKNEELVTYYHATDIICIPALSDTFTVIKEGMSSGKPVIVTDVCSHAERVSPGVNGFVVPPKDSKAIAHVLLKIANNPIILDRLSANAPKTSSRYDWNNILDKYLKVI